jgi:hypothetical protein
MLLREGAERVRMLVQFVLAKGEGFFENQNGNKRRNKG